MAATAPFWRTKTLGEMTRAEWESLCDGCARCCLHKLRDEDTNELGWTDVACRLLDTQSCRCSDYANRKARVPDCVKLTPKRVAEIDWLPPTCAYRLLAEREAGALEDHIVAWPGRIPRAARPLAPLRKEGNAP